MGLRGRIKSTRTFEVRVLSIRGDYVELELWNEQEGTATRHSLKAVEDTFEIKAQVFVSIRDIPLEFDTDLDSKGVQVASFKTVIEKAISDLNSGRVRTETVVKRLKAGLKGRV